MFVASEDATYAAIGWSSTNWTFSLTVQTIGPPPGGEEGSMTEVYGVVRLGRSGFDTRHNSVAVVEQYRSGGRRHPRDRDRVRSVRGSSQQCLELDMLATTLGGRYNATPW